MQKKGAHFEGCSSLPKTLSAHSKGTNAARARKLVRSGTRPTKQKKVRPPRRANSCISSCTAGSRRPLNKKELVFQRLHGFPYGKDRVNQHRPNADSDFVSNGADDRRQRTGHCAHVQAGVRTRCPPRSQRNCRLARSRRAPRAARRAPCTRAAMKRVGHKDDPAPRNRSSHTVCSPTSCSQAFAAAPVPRSQSSASQTSRRKLKLKAPSRAHAPRCRSMFNPTVRLDQSHPRSVQSVPLSKTLWKGPWPP